MYLDYIHLLPQFSCINLSEKLVNDYFDNLPMCSKLTADVLSDGAGFDSDIPFNNNILIASLQQLVKKEQLSEEVIKSIIKTFDYLDFKFSMVFLLQLLNKFDNNKLFDLLDTHTKNVFMDRFERFLSVYVAEFLCEDGHNGLL